MADHDDDDDLQIDQWDNTIGDDDELDAIWASLLAAAGTGKPAEIEARLATHLATQGARHRRIAEGLILAASAASALTPDPTQDWRVTLHRHFIRDQPLPIAEAAAALIASRNAGRAPNWHGMSAQAPLRLLISYVRDMRGAAAAMAASGDHGAAASTLYELSSELFDFSMALTPDDAEMFRDNREVAVMMTDILRVITEATSRTSAARGSEAEKARALVEVTNTQLGISSAALH